MGVSTWEPFQGFCGCPGDRNCNAQSWQATTKGCLPYLTGPLCVVWIRETPQQTAILSMHSEMSLGKARFRWLPGICPALQQHQNVQRVGSCEDSVSTFPTTLVHGDHDTDRDAALMTVNVHVNPEKDRHCWDTPKRGSGWPKSEILTSATLRTEHPPP